jgi:hypothetical protein
MSKSPIANWQPKTETGIDNARLLKAHADKKRAANAKAVQQAKRGVKPQPGSPQSKKLAAARKSQLDANRWNKVSVTLSRRQRLPTDETWQLDTHCGEPMLSPDGAYDATEQQWSSALELAKPLALVSRGGTLYSALCDVRQLIDDGSKPIWIPPESNWLCMWFPTCGTIDQVRLLLSLNPALAGFYRLILPATWITLRRHGGRSDGVLYRGWREALACGEPATHWGCYAMIYLDSPAQRQVLYESTLARLRLAGHGVVELNRGVLFQPVAELVLHETITDQPLKRVPRGEKFGGPKKTHETFLLEASVALDCPAKHSNLRPSVKLTTAEERQYQQLIQRKAAPITLDEECCQWAPL